MSEAKRGRWAPYIPSFTNIQMAMATIIPHQRRHT